jgi:hypothetical protein
MEIDKLTFDVHGRDVFIWCAFVLCTNCASCTKVFFFVTVYSGVTFMKKDKKDKIGIETRSYCFVH